MSAIQQRARFGNSGDQFLASLVGDAKHLPGVIYLDTKYSEDEPRVPAGGPGGGEWGDGSGDTSDASTSKIRDDITHTLDELGMGSFPLAFVNQASDKSLEALMARAYSGSGDVGAYFEPKGLGGKLTFDIGNIAKNNADAASVTQHEATHVRFNNWEKSDPATAASFLSSNKEALRLDENTAPSRYAYTNWVTYGIRESAGIATPIAMEKALSRAANESLAEMNRVGKMSNSTYEKLNQMVNASWATSKWGKG